MAMMLEEDSMGSVAVRLEDSVASGGGACADANPQVKIKTEIKKKRVIFSFKIFSFKIVKVLVVQKWLLTPTLTTKKAALNS
jgi:hypothetical protein